MNEDLESKRDKATAVTTKAFEHVLERCFINTCALFGQIIEPVVTTRKGYGTHVAIIDQLKNFNGQYHNMFIQLLSHVVLMCNARVNNPKFPSPETIKILNSQVSFLNIYTEELSLIYESMCPFEVDNAAHRTFLSHVNG